MISKTYYVYQLTDPRNDNQPFYIGKGKGYRSSVHMTASRRHENPRKWAKITAIKNAGLEVGVVKVGENLTEIEALDLEESLILKFGRLDLDDGGILTNRRKRGVDHKDNWNKKSSGRPAGIPAWNKGRTLTPHSEESKRLMSEKRKEWWRLKRETEASRS